LLRDQDILWDKIKNDSEDIYFDDEDEEWSHKNPRNNLGVFYLIPIFIKYEKNCKTYRVWFG
jgi:hypothetical protein